MILSKYRSTELRVDSFYAIPDETWCFFGSFTSGIDHLFRVLSGELPCPELELAEKPAVVSFARQQVIFNNELRSDNTDFIGHIDPGTPTRKFIHNSDKLIDLIAKLNFNHCLNTRYRQLSSGESRKLQLLAAISLNPIHYPCRTPIRWTGP